MPWNCIDGWQATIFPAILGENLCQCSRFWSLSLLLHSMFCVCGWMYLYSVLALPLISYHVTFVAYVLFNPPGTLGKGHTFTNGGMITYFFQFYKLNSWQINKFLYICFAIYKEYKNAADYCSDGHAGFSQSWAWDWLTSALLQCVIHTVPMAFDTVDGTASSYPVFFRRGLLLQEGNRPSEALHYYKLAIGSRPTLACKYSLSPVISGSWAGREWD